MTTWGTLIDRLVNEVGTWPGVSVEPHRFGGLEFNLDGSREIGHIHRNGMLDIPFTRHIRDALIEAGRALPHHLLVDSGWSTYMLRDNDDYAGAAWLLRVSYLHSLITGNTRSGNTVDLDMVAEMLMLLDLPPVLETGFLDRLAQARAGRRKPSQD